MGIATREELVSMFGELDDLTVARVIALQPTIQQLREAQEWLFSASIESRSGHPDQRIARIAQILADDLLGEVEEEVGG